MRAVEVDDVPGLGGDGELGPVFPVGIVGVVVTPELVRHGLPHRRVVAEDVDPLPEHVHLRRRGGLHEGVVRAEALSPLDSRALMLGVRDDLRQRPEIPALVKDVRTDEQERVAGLQVERRSLEVGVRVVQGGREGDGLGRGNGVPLGPRHDLFDRLERLRLLAGAGDALYPQAGLERHRCGRHGRRRARVARCRGRHVRWGLEREGEVRLGGDARPQAVPDQPPELLQRDPPARRAQVRLLREALVVEGEHVRGNRERVEERDGEVVAIAGAEVGEARPVGVREAGDHRCEEVSVRPDAVRDRGQPRAVLYLERRPLGDAGAATAGGGGGGAHLPPPAVSTSTP